MVRDSVYTAIVMHSFYCGLMTMDSQLALLSGDEILSLMRRLKRCWLLLNDPYPGKMAHQNGNYALSLCPSRLLHHADSLANLVYGKVLRRLYRPPSGIASEKTVVHAPVNLQSIS
jgi:hypothetical protein